MTDAVQFDNVSIVFGDHPETALPLMDDGLDRAEIQTRCAFSACSSDAASALVWSINRPSSSVRSLGMRLA